MWTQTYIVPSGYIGFAVSAQSWVKSFRVAVTSDTGLIDAALNKRFCDLIEQNIQKEKDRMKDAPVPESPEKKKEK